MITFSLVITKNCKYKNSTANNTGTVYHSAHVAFVDVYEYRCKDHCWKNLRDVILQLD